jgi:hypothetical protein
MPGPPVCGAHLNLPAGFCVEPSAEHPPAWEHKLVRPVAVYDGQLQVSIKRRARDVFPHARIMRYAHAAALIQITSGAADLAEGRGQHERAGRAQVGHRVFRPYRIRTIEA